MILSTHTQQPRYKLRKRLTFSNKNGARRCFRDIRTVFSPVSKLRMSVLLVVTHRSIVGMSYCMVIVQIILLQLSTSQQQQLVSTSSTFRVRSYFYGTARGTENRTNNRKIMKNKKKIHDANVMKMASKRIDKKFLWMKAWTTL